MFGVAFYLEKSPAMAVCNGLDAFCITVSESKTPSSSESLLDKTLKDFRLTASSIHDFIERLRVDYKVPISFIPEKSQKSDHKDLILELRHGTFKDLLEKALEIRPEYRYQTVSGRLVFYPKLAEYDLVVQGVDLQSIERRKAAQQYLMLLRAQFPEFQKLVGTPLRGNPKAPLYAELVSLRKTGTVIEHFVDLLGSNPMYVFSVRESETGFRALVFYNVERLQTSGKMSKNPKLFKNFK